MEAVGTRRGLIVSRAWVQAAVLVFLAGFLVLGILAYRTYSAEPPIARRAVAPDGRTLYTSSDVHEGQRIFLRNGLMEYGSIFGHGAYLGPDYTADYLHRAALAVRARYGGARSDRAVQETITDFRANRYDTKTKTCATHWRRRRRSTSWSTTTRASSAIRRRRTGCVRRRSRTPPTLGS